MVRTVETILPPYPIKGHGKPRKELYKKPLRKDSVEISDAARELFRKF
jgi:hypothetical protein